MADPRWRLSLSGICGNHRKRGGSDRGAAKSGILERYGVKGTIYHQPEYKPSTPSQNQTGGMNHGSNGLRDEYDNPEDLYEDNPDWFENENEEGEKE